MDRRASQRTKRAGGVLGVDGDGTITVVSPAEAQICARPATELLGRSVAALLERAPERRADGEAPVADRAARRELLHELGNLVMTMHGCVELAQRKLGEDAAVRCHLNDARNSSTRAVGVVRELMGLDAENTGRTRRRE